MSTEAPVFSLSTFPVLADPARTAAYDAARAHGHSAGYADGVRQAAAENTDLREQMAAEHAAMLAAGNERIERAVAALNAAAASLTERTLPVVAHALDSLGRGSLALAEAVIGVELSHGPTSARAALTRALAAVDADVATRVRMHPRDLAALDEDVRAACTVPLVADANLQPGDAVTDMPDGFLDARITTAVDRTRTQLELALQAGGR